MQIRPGYYEIQNAGKLRNQGYELDAAYKYEGLTLRAGVAYSKPELDGRTVDSTVTSPRFQLVVLGPQACLTASNNLTLKSVGKVGLYNTPVMIPQLTTVAEVQQLPNVQAMA